MAGAFVHFAPAVYVLAAALDAWRIVATVAKPQATTIIPDVLRDSVFGLAIYAGLALVATSVAAVFDRAARPHHSPGDLLALALDGARGRFGERADTALDQLGVLVNGASDPRLAPLAQHCEALLTASLLAIASAPAVRREAIATRTIEALESLAREAHDLDAAAGAAHDDHAAALARFVVARYGGTTLDRTTDSAGDGR